MIYGPPEAHTKECVFVTVPTSPLCLPVITLISQQEKAIMMQCQVSAGVWGHYYYQMLPIPYVVK